MATNRMTLQGVRTRLRRIQLTMGLGFFSMVLGACLAAWAVPAFAYVVAHQGGTLLPTLLGIFLANLWLLVVLPALAFALGRVTELSPWPTGLGAVVTGEMFFLALDSLMTVDEEPRLHAVRKLGHAFCLGAGVLLTQWTVRRSHAGLARVQRAAADAAEARKKEYEAFELEAKRLAERGEHFPIPAPPAALEGAAAAEPIPASLPEPPSGPSRPT